MKCDKCGKPSVYHSTLIVNGVSQTTNLCRECALKEGVFEEKPMSFFDEMFSTFADFLPFEKVADIECPVCKTTLREFKNTSLLGCPNCYDTFRDEIKAIIQKIEPYSYHKQDKIQDVKSPNKLADLKSEMAQAVKEERYEDAAKLKKQIKKMEEDHE